MIDFGQECKLHKICIRLVGDATWFLRGDTYAGCLERVLIRKLDLDFESAAYPTR
jgi:hypothetical protein